MAKGSVPMKKSKNIFKILTIFFTIIGLCIVALLSFIFIYTYVNGSFSKKTMADVPVESASPLHETESDSNIDEAESDSSIDETESVQQEEPAANKDLPTPTPVPQKTVESGSYHINNTDFWFSDSVINDVTGRLKISSLAAEIDASEYAAMYYNTLFSSDDEIHAVVNFTTNTTTSISVLQDGMLDVAVHEYVSGEEHDSQTLFSGTLIEEYFVNIETGEVKGN